MYYWAKFNSSLRLRVRCCCPKLNENVYTRLPLHIIRSSDCILCKNKCIQSSTKLATKNIEKINSLLAYVVTVDVKRFQRFLLEETQPKVDNHESKMQFKSAAEYVTQSEVHPDSLEQPWKHGVESRPVVQLIKRLKKVKVCNHRGR